MLVLTEGHSFVGVWLMDEDFSNLVVDDAQMLRKRVQLKEIILVETTLLTGSNPARFHHAVEAAANTINALAAKLNDSVSSAQSVLAPPASTEPPQPSTDQPTSRA